MSYPATAFIVVAIAGLALPIHVRTRKLLAHCGMTVVEIPSRVDALNELRRKVRVHALVVDARLLPPSIQEAPDFVALTSSGRSTAGEEPMAVVVLGNRRVPAWARSICDRVGARFINTRPERPNYTELIHVLRGMCGLPTDCCTPLAHHPSDEAEW